MENASKALIMAGGILFSIIIISLLVLFSGNIRKLKQDEYESKATLQATEFNKQFTAYERKIYGSELFSIANKVENYNQKFSNIKDADKYQEDYVDSNGYRKVEFYVKFNKDIDDTYFTKTTGDNGYTAKDLIDKVNAIDTIIAQTKNVKIQPNPSSSKEITVAKFASERKKDILMEYGIDDDRYLKIKNGSLPGTQNFANALEKYTKYKNLVSEVKQKTFEFVELKNSEKYDSNGRIIKIQYIY